jgi:hypothetical protein
MVAVVPRSSCIEKGYLPSNRANREIHASAVAIEPTPAKPDDAPGVLLRAKSGDTPRSLYLRVLSQCHASSFERVYGYFLSFFLSSSASVGGVEEVAGCLLRPW